MTYDFKREAVQRCVMGYLDVASMERWQSAQDFVFRRNADKAICFLLFVRGCRRVCPGKACVCSLGKEVGDEVVRAFFGLPL